jgi:hypothetical protein
VDKKSFLKGISAKLSVLMGGALLVQGAQATIIPTETASPSAPTTATSTISGRSPLPAKLTLKQQKNGFKVVAQHDSHSSHSSHSSHASHSSGGF